MKTIDLENWPRRKHYELYRKFDYPHFSLTAPLELTRFYPAVRSSGASLTLALIFLLARSANALPEFRQRIRGEQVVEHDVVHPAPTVLTDSELFSFYQVDFVDDFRRFAAAAELAIAAARVAPRPCRTNRGATTGCSFRPSRGWPSPPSPTRSRCTRSNSIPRLSWGKFSEAGGRLSLPLSVQVHHSLMDGVHVGRFYELVQAGLDDPSWLD